MAFGPSSPITGATATGLTSPTYTVTQDTPPNSHSEQLAVTALGGTQTGVVAHSVSSPFTITMERPAQFKQLGQPNPSTGVVASVPRNVYTVRTRKGVLPLAGQASQVMLIETKISVPAGSDNADPLSVRAALSAHVGTLNADSTGISSTITDGIL